MADPRAMFDLTGRVAVVTGASAGLGQQAANALVQAGAKVVGVARREAQLSDWASTHGNQVGCSFRCATLRIGACSI